MAGAYTAEVVVSVRDVRAVGGSVRLRHRLGRRHASGVAVPRQGRHGRWAGIDGRGAPVRVRILHIFELRDGLIAHENAWFNAADVLRQVTEWSAGSP
jgi:hypothetical protein